MPSFLTAVPTPRRPAFGKVSPALSVLAALSLLTLACGGGGAPPDDGARAEADSVQESVAETASVSILSGRAESVLRPVLERFLEDTGTEVEVRYGDSAELAASLLGGEGPPPADVFLSEGAAPLGSLAAGGLLRPLPQEVLQRVPGNLTDPDGLWVGLSGRARTVVYDTRRLGPDELPQDLDAVGDQRFHGRWGLAPLERSFEAHLTVYRALNGGEALDDLLARMAADEPRVYASGDEVVAAVAAGDLDWGLVDHFDLWHVLATTPDAPLANFYMPAGDASGFVNLSGAGVLTDNPAAVELVRYLLSDASQRLVSRETYEYPLVEGVAPAVDLLPLAELDAPDIDFREVAAELDATREAIRRSGLAE